MKPRPDLLDSKSPAGIEAFQLTTKCDIPASHVYMEAQIFAPDSRRLVLHESAHAHGSDKDDPNHRYLLCDLDNDGQLSPLTTELGPTAPSIDPSGRWLYYLVDRTIVNGGTLELKRVGLDGTGRETLIRWDSPIRGSSNQIGRIYPLSSISSDSKRFAFAGFLGDGNTPNDNWGLVVVDLETLESNVVVQDPRFVNLHPQYSRSKAPGMERVIMIQDNHGATTDAQGVVILGCAGVGADIHVIRDDGTDWHQMPMGRSEDEQCQGHQCWRGRSDAIIGAAGQLNRKMPRVPGKGEPAHEEWLIETLVSPGSGHTGILTPGGKRNVLHGNFKAPPRFFHFATDIEGRRMIADYDPDPLRGMGLYLADLAEPMSGPVRKWTYLLDTRTDFFAGRGHPHPFLSPDGTMGFFNSTESGILQAYMVRGLERIVPEGI